MATDWTDPCARAGALRTAYYNLLAGGGGAVQSVRFADRMITYGTGATSLATLRSELTLAESECAKSTGEAPRRFAIRAGSRLRSTE